MELSQSERRLFQAHEDEREAAQIGADAEVECVACEVDSGGEAVVLQGAVYCSDCAFARAIKLRGDDTLWSELSRHDQTEALEIIETQAHIERAALTRKAVR